jgi:histidine triad (HIT) family protein
MAANTGCIFCKIVAGEIPAARVFGTDRVVAFLDINPVSPGHLLVVAANHSACLSEADPADLADVAAELPRLVRAVLKATGAPACNVVVNDGREAGQVVPHVHFHVVPRRAGDGLGPRWPHGSYTDQEQEAMCRRIEEALD